MQVSVHVGEGLTREMRVDLPAEDIEAEIDKRLQRFARSARAPGFRPGKVPLRLLRQQYGDQVRGEVFGEMVQSTFQTAMQQQALQPIGMPSIEPEVDHKAGRYAYKASFEVFPVFEFKSLANTTIERPVAEVTEADIDLMIERLRDQRRTWLEVARAAQQGDQLKVSFQGSIDGEPFEGGTAENFPIEIGSDRMIPGFEEQLIGASVGGECAFDLRFPEDYHGKHLAGQNAHFKVQIHQIFEPKRPEVDADFIKEMGVGSGEMTEFRADVRDSMDREMQNRIHELVKAQVMDLLIEANPTELPQSLIDQEVRAVRESFSKSAGEQPLPVPESFYTSIARRRVAIALLINEAVKHYRLSVDDAAVREKLTQLAAGYEQPQQVINQYLTDKERLSQLRAGLLEEMVVARQLDEAQVKDTPMSFFDLTEPTRQPLRAA